MDGLTIQELIRAKYSGGVSEVSVWFDLMLQTSLIIFAGIVLWRISAVMHKRKEQDRSRNSYFDTPYSKGWKKK